MESPDLYYEIQHLNPHTARCLELLEIGRDGASGGRGLDEDSETFVEDDEGRQGILRRGLNWQRYR